MKLIKNILILILMFCLYGCATDSEEIVKHPSVPAIQHVYLESEKVVAYFEITNINEYKKLIPSIFGMPERPLCRVSVIDFYKMEKGPPYLESTIEILITYKAGPGEKEILAWYCLEMPVTTEEALWGRFSPWNFPKVLRRITYNRYGNKYIGTSYGRDAKTPALRLTLEVKKTQLTSDENNLYDFVAPIPSLTIGEKKVYYWSPPGGGKYKIYELQKVVPNVYKVQFGGCSLEYTNDPKNYLHRLEVGKFITGYWLNTRSRWVIAPKN